MRTSEIAKRYLDYFEKHGHLIVPSASLISPNPTTLFTIAGMVPFIPYLMGEQTPPKSRMASNQKCVRTLDIDEVGKTTRHGTFSRCWAISPLVITSKKKPSIMRMSC